jgi:DNA-binding MarR family transcriptional regulator
VDTPVQDPLANLPGYALRRAANAMMADLSARLAGVNLRIAEASVLLVVEMRRDMTSSVIGRILDIQRANMVPLLARLENAALIERLPIDRKSQAIVLTTAGLIILGEVQKLTTQFESDLLAKIPAEHRDHLTPALNALWR